MSMDIDENEKITENFDLNPISVPQYLIDLDNFLKSQSIPPNIDCTDINVENHIIYGIKCSILDKKDKYKSCTIFQEDPEPKILSLIKEGSDVLEHLDLTKITHVELKPANEPIMVINVNTLTFTFKFKNASDLFFFLKGLLLFFTKHVLNDESNLQNQTLKIWQKYDSNFDNTLDQTEFISFYNDVNAAGLKCMEISPKEFFEYIDENNDGLIQYDEFFKYFLKFQRGAEFSRFFEKYSTDKLYLSCKDMQNFIKNEQKEYATLNDCAQLIISFKQGLSMQEKENYKNQIKGNKHITSEDLVNVKMSLEEFKLYMISTTQNNIMKTKDDYSNNFPLNDYFVNSSHNTYLTGNQLTGEASADMYAKALLQGYKLVELDCYSPDSTGDVVVTHGYTFTGKCYLKDVMNSIKKNAFEDNSNPVILSCENHMNELGQKIFITYCKNILEDIYIVDEHNLPKSYPTLNELQNKFIIKLSGKRYLLSEEEIQKKLMEASASKKKRITSEKEFVPMDDFLKMEKGTSNLKRKNIMTEKNSEVVREIERKANEEEAKSAVKDKKEPEVKPTSELEAIRGLTKVEFQLNQDYIDRINPWEFVSVKSSKLINLASYTESRRLLTNLAKNGFAKAYPESFSSGNYNPTTLWCSGVQICSLNIQTLSDDMILLNKMFFKSYGDNGYILKPKKLMHNFTNDVELYDYSYGVLHLEIVSLNGLFHYVREKKIETKDQLAKLEISILGSEMEPRMNTTSIKEIRGNLICYEFCNKEEEEKNNLVDFTIYEKNLSFVFFKIFIGKNIIARSCVPLERMKEGIRALTLYDDLCGEIDNACLVVSVKKDFSTRKNKN